MNKFKYIAIAILLFCSVAATPIKDLVLQSDMNAGGFDITNAGDISNGDEVISLDGGSVSINPDAGSSSFDVRSTAGKAIALDTGGLLRLGTHGLVSSTTNDVVLHGSVEVDGSMNLKENAIEAVSQIRFSGGDADQGILSWNAEEETLDLRENGTTLQLGQELHIHVRNSTGSTISNGTVVAFAGTLGASNRILAEPYLADGNTDLHLILGVATEDILDSEDGKVAHFGKVRDIDTSAFNDGDELYASSTVAGGFTTNAPSAPAQAVVIAFVVNSHAINGTIEVIPNWSDENFSSGPATAWSDEGAILRSTNDTVLVSGSGLSADEDQFVVSNDVNGVVFEVDEDGDASYTLWYDNSVAFGRSYTGWIEYFDFRHVVDYDEYWRIIGSTTEEMTFNALRKNLDYIFNGDNKYNLLYMDADTDSVNVHTNAPQSGFGFTVATNAYIHGDVEIKNDLKVQDELSSTPVVFADATQRILLVGSDTAISGDGHGMEVQTPALFSSSDLVSAILIDDVMQLEPRASAPAFGAEAGMIFYHSTSNKLFCFDGTVWNALF